MYARRRTYGRRRYNRRRYYNNYKSTKKVVNTELRKQARKNHPLRWIDVNYFSDGDYIKTTPTVVSLGDAVRDYYAANTDFMDDWLDRNDPTGVGKYKEASIRITGLQYQFRFKQNDAATGPLLDTVRTLAYSHIDTWDENTEGLLAGGDIDQAPYTKDVQSMFWDRLFTLKAGITETSADDSQFVPGQATMKGFKKLNKKFDMTYIPGTGVTWKSGDLRLEFQSDDNSVVGNVEMFGFVRIYWRVM